MLKVVVILLMSFSIGLSNAADVVSDKTSADMERLKMLLSALAPGVKPVIKKSAVPTLYEVTLGSTVAYFSGDGRYMFSGNLIDLQSRKNLTRPARNQARKNAVNSIAEKDMIVFSPKGQVKHSIAIFTDIDCGYCRKLHAEMAAYNKLGIQIKYLFYPRSGLGSASYYKAEAVWCAKDRLQAMTDAKNGVPVKQQSCENPIKQHFSVGEEIGVNGTPAIVLDSGELVPGYLPPQKLLQLLEAKSKGV